MGSQFSCRPNTPSGSNAPIITPSLPPTQQRLRDLGYLLVTDSPYNANPNGTGDSWAGIQQCINDGRDSGHPVWFPYGTYIVSKPLQCYNWELWNGTTSAANTAVHNIQGEWRADGTRPTIKLHATATLFDNTGALAPVMGFQCFSADDAGGTSPPGTPPDNPMTTPAGWSNSNGDLFSCYLRGINFDTSGHVGAVGLNFPGAQWCMVERVKVISNGSWASFGNLPSTGSFNMNIEGVGGQYGIMQTSASQGYNGTGTTIVGLRLSGHTVQSIQNNNFGASTFMGFDVSTVGGGVFWKSTSALNNSGWETASFIDGKISQGSGLVFDQSASGKSIYIRNVYVTGGTTQLIQMDANAVVTGSGTWARINEYSSCDQGGSPGAPYSNPTNTYFTYNVINGSKTRTSEVVIDTDNGTGAPPGDLLTRHYLDPLDTIDTGNFICITDPPYGAVPCTGGSDEAKLDIKFFIVATGQFDSLAAINAAIAAAELAGHNRVFVPWGTYFVSNTLTLRKDTKLFGIGQRASNIAPYESWRPTTGAPYLIDTPADTNGTASLGNITLGIPQVSGTLTGKVYSGNRFSFMKWRVGRKSLSYHLRHKNQFVSNATSDTSAADKFNFNFVSTGGGRHYGICSGSHEDYVTPASRLILSTNSSQALGIYGLNTELCKINAASSTAVANVEINGSSNVRMTGAKCEGNSGILLVSGASRNVALYGAGAMLHTLNASPNYYLRVLTAADNILISCAGVQAYSTQTGPTFYDQGSATTITLPECLALYKKGVIDDSLMVFV